MSAQFKDFEEVGKKYGVSGGGNWMRLEDGENPIRIVSEFEDFGNHFDRIAKKSIICIGKDNGCEICAKRESLIASGKDPKDKEVAELKPRVQFIGWVIDRKTGELKTLTIGYKVFQLIGALAASDEYGFMGVPPYDMTIIKSGKGLETKYSVLAARKDTDLTSEEQQKVSELKPITSIVDSMKAKVTEEANIEPIDEIQVEDII